MNEEAQAPYTVVPPALLDVPDDVLLEAAKTRALAIWESRPSLTSPGNTRSLLQVAYQTAPREVFGALWLNAQHQLLKRDELTEGTVDSANVHPRQVVERGLAMNAVAVIFYHNHPSGSPEPSSADRALTKRLKEALALIDVVVLDHIVVGLGGSTSFAEMGYL